MELPEPENQRSDTVKLSAPDSAPTASSIHSTRRSTRLRNRGTFRRKSATSDIFNCKKWSDKEKILLSKCILKYGSRKIDEIEKNMPTRGRRDIIEFIQKQLRKLEFESVDVQSGASLSCDVKEKLARRKRDSPIEQWIANTERIIKSNKGGDSQDLIFILEDISKNDNHPEVKSKRDVDYSAIYQALADYMRGEIPGIMNAETRSKMLEMLQKLKHFYKDNKESFDGISHFISQSYFFKDLCDLAEPNANFFSFNPLQFPSSVLTIQTAKGSQTSEP